ncbi:hypothetical protein [uncultured Anaerococcus sp.]|uniref:hypothetical protein n=1 Tax=uncultured Anaerococcus sp. TaxID=293428 RepID=UPI002620397A|nr:hypothetical protein [uncultured Anaerococcus sp.]
MRDIIMGEFFGTMLFILLDDGGVANVLLNKSGQKGVGSIQITIAWGGFSLNPCLYIVLFLYR